MVKADSGEWPEGWPEWVVEIVQALEKIEEEAIDRCGQGDWGGLNGPKWVQEMGGEVMKILNPTIRFRDRNQSGPTVLGALIGHQQWLIQAENGLTAQLERAATAADFALARLKKKLKPETYEAVIKGFEVAAQQWEQRVECAEWAFKQKNDVVSKAMALVNQQATSEQAEFHVSYGKALGTDLYDGEGHLTHGGLSSTYHIYFLMVLCWQQMKTFRTVTELHAWLCRYLGASQVGDLDRVKGICKRFKVKLASRGRPRTKNGTRLLRG